MKKRGSGVLLHITSLPSAFGIGDLGPEAFAFVDFLFQTRQTYWQMLPLNPTDLMYGNSPYSSSCAFALSPLIVSPQVLFEDGWLEKSDLSSVPPFPAWMCDFAAVAQYKVMILTKAFEHFRKVRGKKTAYEKFLQDNASWLQDFVLFSVIKQHFQGLAFTSWPKELRDRERAALKVFEKNHADQIEKESFIQFVATEQWMRLKEYCHQKGITTIGDIPIYVNDDSIDVWAHPHLFKLGPDKKPSFVAGVPPDYFSETGQRWGNPVYNWEKLHQSKYVWWKDRIRQNLKLFDMLRIDHFRGFESYWEIPATESTAVNGSWVKVPGEEFFMNMEKEFHQLPFIAEDLGSITPAVTELMDRFQFPGMKVLLFAFGGDTETHPYIPKNYLTNCVVYTGTHDNNTARGWFDHEASAEEKANLTRYLGYEPKTQEIAWILISMAMESVADGCLIPLQDVLNLPTEARMNKPGTTQGNWRWRFAASALSPQIKEKLLSITESSRRSRN